MKMKTIQNSSLPILIENKQYSYTDMNSFITSLAKYNGWLMIKQGLTLEQEINDRANQQDNASSTAAPIVFSTLVVLDNDDSKLDDKIRDYLHKTDLFMEYSRYDNENKKHEWSLVKIDDLVDDFKNLRNTFIELQKNSKKFELDEFVAENFLYKSDFMHKLDERVYNSKKEAVEYITGKPTYKDITLRPWQEETVSEMITAGKFYNLLSLAPRFGKTITILEYVNRLSTMMEERLVLLPASKNLASNTSFDTDYIDAGYMAKNEFDICTKGSLFVATTDKKMELSDLIAKRIDLMKPELEGKKIVLVTDEADIASHTENSIEFIEAIKSEFNVVKQIAMSGTGIFKAAKIFKGIQDDEVFFKSVNYTELLDYDIQDVVARNFFNIQYNMSDIIDEMEQILKSEGKDIEELSNKDQKTREVFNVNQAFNQISAFPSIVKYTTSLVRESPMTKKLGLQNSKAIMVFTPSKTKKNLELFVDEFKEQNPDIETLILTGDYTNNREAQNKVKIVLDNMRKMNDDRLLLVFSKDMGSRSFSIPNIRRVIIFGDSEISSAWYQKSARCLTYNYNECYTKPNQAADIIRVSFNDTNIISELFLIENETVDRSENTQRLMEKQLKRNSFVNVYMGDEDDYVIQKDYREVNDSIIMQEIDAILKYTDTTKYIMTQLFGVDLDTSSDAKHDKKKAKLISSVDLSIPKLKKDKTIDKIISLSNEESLTADDEKDLEVYVDILRTLPYVAKFFKAHSYDEFIEMEWDNKIIIPKDGFLNNMCDKSFNSIVKTIFRNVNDGDEILKERVQEYLQFMSV